MDWGHIVLLIGLLWNAVFGFYGWRRYKRACELNRCGYFYSGGAWYAPGREYGVQMLTFNAAWKELRSNSPKPPNIASNPPAAGRWMEE